MVDRPSVPEGPLKPIETFKDRCRLQWAQPKDLGGLPLDHYLVEACDITGEETDDWYKVRSTDESNNQSNSSQSNTWILY